jgi:hypothetical protein
LNTEKGKGEKGGERKHVGLQLLVEITRYTYYTRGRCEKSKAKNNIYRAK